MSKAAKQNTNQNKQMQANERGVFAWVRVIHTALYSRPLKATRSEHAVGFERTRQLLSGYSEFRNADHSLLWECGARSGMFSVHCVTTTLVCFCL